MRYLIAVLFLSGCGYPPIANERVETKQPIGAAVEWPIEAVNHERLHKVVKPPFKLTPLPPPTPLSHDPICDIIKDDKEGVMARLECIERNLWR